MMTTFQTFFLKLKFKFEDALRLVQFENSLFVA